MKSLNAQEVVNLLGLLPHPEGGFYKETYRSSDSVVQTALPKRFSGDRFICTSIYYLLPEDERSVLHRIKSDETWHFYLGGPLKIVGINTEGKPYSVLLGQNIMAGEVLQFTVPAGDWFGAKAELGGSYSLVGCTVAPGFDFSDFEIGNRSQLSSMYPNAKALIEEFTKPDAPSIKK